MSKYTEENAQQALEYGEKQLRHALWEFLRLRDVYNGNNHLVKWNHVERAHAATCGALVAVKELYQWLKPT